MRKFFRRLWRIISAPFRLLWWVIRKIFGWFHTIFTNLSVLFMDEPEDAPLPEAFAKAVENPMGVLEHVNELRKHIFRALLFMMIATGVSFAFVNQLLEFLTQPIGGLNELTAIEVTEPVGVVMRVSLLAGFAISLPYIVLELWLFAAPGLRRSARIRGLITIPIASLLFVAGMAFAYYVMMPTALPFLLNFMGINTAVRPASYISFVTGLLFWIGLAFEFPLVIFALAGLGIVNAKTLLTQWRIAVVVVAVISAMITPTIDPVNMALVMGPMMLLYFFSIGLAYIAQGRRKNAEDG